MLGLYYRVQMIWIVGSRCLDCRFRCCVEESKCFGLKVLNIASCCSGNSQDCLLLTQREILMLFLFGLQLAGVDKLSR